MNILEEVQIYVADRLNADSQLSGLCPFIPENRKDIDYEIKSALGKQGVVGLVMTPKATFAGAYEDKSLAWQLDELEIDIIENVTVNRGKKNGYVTGQDAAMRLFEVLCPLTGENEGQFNAVSYEEGEDNNLLVNKCVLKCLVHTDTPKGKYTYAVLDGETLSALYEGTFTGEMFKAFSPSNYNHITDLSIGTAIDKLSAYCFYGGTNLSSVVLPDTITELGDGAFYLDRAIRNVQMKEGISAIGQECFFDCRALRVLEIPSSVQTIGRMAFKVTNDPYGQGLSSIAFKGKSLEQVQAMENYPWGIPNPSTVIHVTD